LRDAGAGALFASMQGLFGRLLRKLARKVAFALHVPVIAPNTIPQDITSLSQIFPEIIRL